MFFVDLLSIFSIVGIWPRFIEPKLLKQSYVNWDLNDFNKHLEGLRILHFSDLHFHNRFPQRFLEKISKKINQLKPDLILFTGDFICYGNLQDPQRLQKFLQSLSAPMGCYCIFGNHDYATYVSRNAQGVFDTIRPFSTWKGLFKGVQSIFSGRTNKNHVSENASKVGYNKNLVNLLKETPFTLLENTTHTLPCGLNLCGLGDLAVGRCLPEAAFSNYNPNYPGIVLSHNPDTAMRLKTYPGEWILSGHTHGEQIHFPWPKFARNISKRLARLEYPELTRGLLALSANKKLYVNRGIGCHKPFRLFSPPELCLIKASTSR